MADAPVAIPDTPTVVGPRVPRRGNFFSRWLARTILRVWGWRMVGDLPDREQFLITAAPHTSNIDGLLLLFGAYSIGLDMHWVVKHTALKGLFGYILLWTGAVGVNRKAAGGMVQQVLDTFAKRPQFVLVVAPEGTRSRVETWKSGFHRIASRAKVPVCMGFIDYRVKRLGFGGTFEPSGDYAKDLAKMVEFYRLITPRFPERFALPSSLAE
jgi:1-acyl-sn-glycerol-3-phosphate acyltransferase